MELRAQREFFLTNRQREHKALFDDVIVLFPNDRSVNKVGIKRFDSSSNYFVQGPKISGHVGCHQNTSE